MNYNEMGVIDLRKLLCERKIGAGAWRATCSKGEAISALEASDRGEVPQVGVVKAPEAQPQAAPQGDLGSMLGSIVLPYLEQRLKATVDVDQVKSLIDDAVGAAVKRVEIKVADLEPMKVEGEHFLFPLVMACVANRINVYLVGPAGSGKTHLCGSVARKLGLNFHAISVCGQTSEYALRGYMDANGKYVRTGFREAYEHGGVFCLDEVDAGNPNVIAVINSATANGHASFPDGMVEKHKDFVLIACGNTFGQGANAQYVGRNPLDAATLDRFAFVRFPYDPSLEGSMIGVSVPAPAFDITEGGEVDGRFWIEKVQKLRESAEEKGVKAIFSPRATLMGVKLLMAGVGVKHVEDMVLRKGLDQAAWDKINS